MKTICSMSPCWPSKLGLFFTMVAVVSLLGCKKTPQHIHNGPEYHRVNQSLIVPIEVKQSHDSDASQKLILSPGAGGPRLNLNFPGKSSSNQSVTNNNANRTRGNSDHSNRQQWVNSGNNPGENAGGNPPPYAE